MDVYFEAQEGESFSIEVGFFDTVFEIKEKIQKYKGIPTPKQTLIFNGRVLQDDLDVQHCEILQNSCIKLVVKPLDNNHHVKTETPPLPPSSISLSPFQNQKIYVNVNVHVPSSEKRTTTPFEMNFNDTVLNLKERVREVEHLSTPINMLTIRSNGVELHDHHLLRDCKLMDNNNNNYYYEVDVSFKPSQNRSTTTMMTNMVVGPNGNGRTTNASNRKLTLMVLTKCGTRKIPVEVNAWDNIGELRKELEKLHQRLHLNLPQEEYFFIYKQNVMDDDKSFRWHHVCQGDTIEIFNGSVSGGT